MTESLGFGQVRFAASDFLSQQLVLRHIHGGADDSFQRAILNDGSTHASNVPHFTVRSHDALGDIASRSLRNHVRNQRCHELAILRMDACEVFLKARCFFGRIQTVYVKKLTRPVLEKACREENPAAHVREAFSLRKVELRSFAFLNLVPDL